MATAAVNDRMTMIAELRGRIDGIDYAARSVPIGELCHRIAAIGNIARATGMLPLARLAGSLSDALIRDGRGAAVRTWTDAMRESIGHDAQDEATARLFLASVGVRLAG